jgi:hypothetical protein
MAPRLEEWTHSAHRTGRVPDAQECKLPDLQ